MATTSGTKPETVLANVRQIAEGFAEQRAERQRRTALERADFDALRDSGLLLTGVPAAYGGLWEGTAQSTRTNCEIFRALAHGDSSVALVATMHPAVIGFAGWLRVADAPAPYTEDWNEQREWVFQTAREGHFWGTIVSEPGSGGDVNKTKAVAKRGATNGEYLLSGEKHFGSGSGMTSFMVTTAIPEGEDDADVFFMDMRGRPWDGSAGIKLIAPWDGHGMTATQSHGLAFKDMPATRLAWPGRSARRQAGGDSASGALFTAVIVGIIETAVGTARASLAKRRDSLRPYEQVEWSRVETEAWLIRQAYEGMLRAAETGQGVARASLLGKESIAELAESLMLRLSKVVGGGSYSRYAPYGYWLEDVRALGFLRPPSGLAFDNIFNTTWDES